MKEDDGRDGGSFASAGSHSATEEANVDHITGRPASTHLQVWTLYTVSEGECERQEDRQRST